MDADDGASLYYSDAAYHWGDITFPGEGDLEVIKTPVVYGTFRPGDELSYRFRYKNIGTMTMSDAVLIERLPEHITWVSGGLPFPDNEFRFPLGTLVPGQEGEETMRVRINPDLPPRHRHHLQCGGGQVRPLDAYYPCRSGHGPLRRSGGRICARGPYLYRIPRSGSTGLAQKGLHKQTTRTYRRTAAPLR